MKWTSSGSVTGMAIRAGVTLVVGGGFHGKSTLLRALELGCYDHVPGDGREFVVCDPTAVKIRAEDGRGVERVDISPFISNLPFGKRTDAFSTPDASGSTSQAANIMEALEVGCEVLLIDEDTAATNFMIRSAEMRRLVSPEKEPITPFIAKVRALADVGPDPDVTGPGPGPGPGDGASGVTPPTGVTPRRVSSILVLGGSGDYFAVADTVICMENYAPRDVTAEAAAIARDAFPPGTIHVDERFGKVAARVPDPSSVDAGARPPEVPTTETILWGDDQREIRLGAVEQLCERGQTRFIAEALAAMARTGCVDGGRTTAEALDALEALIAGGDGMDAVGGTRGDLALPRRFEIAAALNRLRGVRMTQRGRSARS